MIKQTNRLRCQPISHQLYPSISSHFFPFLTLPSLEIPPFTLQFYAPTSFHTSSILPTLPNSTSRLQSQYMCKFQCPLYRCGHFGRKLMDRCPTNKTLEIGLCPLWKGQNDVERPGGCPRCRRGPRKQSNKKSPGCGSQVV